MSSLVVGGTAIKVAVSSPRWTRSDGVDRSRSLDGTLRASQTGGAVRVWDFETPPVLAATEGETYKAALSTVASQLCSGDIIALPTMCSAELTDGVPTSVAGEPYVVLSFTLHEQQPAKVLLRYAPGDAITGESFTRSTTAFQIDSTGLLVSKAINTKRDGHYTSIGGTRSILQENARTNNWLHSQEFDNAAWGKSETTIAANATTAPDGTATADKIVEAATTAAHYIQQQTVAGGTISTRQSVSFRLKAGERTWAWVFMYGSATGLAYFNLSAGTVGTVSGTGSPVARIRALANGFYECELTAILPAAGVFFGGCGPATADATQSYLGDITKGIYVWGAQVEVDAPFASSYIPTTTAAVARGADSYSLPFTTPPQEMTGYAKFVEGGTLQVSGDVFQIADSIGNVATFRILSSGAFYRTEHITAGGSATSTLAAAPSMGDLVELAARFFGDGSDDVTQSLNSAQATTAAQSAALTPASTWSAQLCWLNCVGSARVGFTSLQSFKIVAGARSLAEMRSL